MDVAGAFEALRQADIIANAGRISPPKRSSDYRKVAILLVSKSFFNHAHDEGRLDEVNFELISLLHRCWFQLRIKSDIHNFAVNDAVFCYKQLFKVFFEHYDWIGSDIAALGPQLYKSLEDARVYCRT